MPNNYSKKRGVVILFAVLLVTVILTISLGIFNITYRQLVLSSIARESEVAFSVADSARNCAVYWDSSERAISDRPFGYYKYEGLDEDSQPVFTLVAQAGTVDCAQAESVVVTPDNEEMSGIDYQTSTFQLKFKVEDPYGDRDVCANVVVAKSLINPGVPRHTVITVDGYNLAATVENPETGCIPVDHSRAVQRTIQTVHPG